MKVIAILHAFVGFRESLEDYQPETIILPQDMIDLVRTTYQFSQFPVLRPGQPLPNIYAYSAGRLLDGEHNFGIGQLVMSQDGDVVLTLSTEQSELVLNHLITLLDEKFGYRLRESPIKKRYLTNLVVEFDRGLEEYMQKFLFIEKEINRAGIPDRGQFKLKQISFGDSPETMIGTTNPFQLMENADFIVQRRAEHEFSKNRYYCSAPLPSSVLIHTLERIEAIARGNAA
jgi:hypothetical protein